MMTWLLDLQQRDKPR